MPNLPILDSNKKIVQSQLPVHLDPTVMADQSTADRLRSNHSGTQLSTTISDFTEAAQDVVAGLLVAGAGVTLAYSDSGNTLTITANDTADTIVISSTATANSTDAALRARPSHTGIDNSPTGAVDGQVMTVTNGQIVPQTLPDVVSPAFNLRDASDVPDATPLDGTILVWSTAQDSWILNPRARAVYAYASGEALDPFQPPGLIVDGAAVTILRSHAFEGTNGSTVDYTTMGYDNYTGATRTYTNAQALVGSTSVLVAAGTQGYYTDDGLGLTTAVLKGRVRFNGTPTGVINFAEQRLAANGVAASSLAALQRDTAGLVRVKDGSGATRATSTTALAPDTWFVFEWKVGQASQTLRLYDAGGTNLLETITTSATSGTVATINYGIYANFGGGVYLDKSSVAADWMGTAG